MRKMMTAAIIATFVPAAALAQATGGTAGNGTAGSSATGSAGDGMQPGQTGSQMNSTDPSASSTQSGARSRSHRASARGAGMHDPAAGDDTGRVGNAPHGSNSGGTTGTGTEDGPR